MKTFVSSFHLVGFHSRRRIHILSPMNFLSPKWDFSRGLNTSILTKWNDNAHLENDHDEIELELSFQSSLNAQRTKLGDHFITDILKNRKSRRFKRKLKTQYGFYEQGIDLKKFDLNGLPMYLQPIETKTYFDSSEAFNRYMSEILSRSYPDPTHFNSIMMGIVKGINQYQSQANVESFNLILRYLIRRGKWGKVYKMIDLMPLYNVYPNRDTLAWLLRGCHNKVEKPQRMALVKSVLNLGINKWKLECSNEIKIMIWLALPYCKDWVNLNNVLLNEGLKELMDQKLVINHYIRNMMVHFMWIKSRTPIETYLKVKTQFQNKVMVVNFPRDKVFSEAIKDAIKHWDYYQLWKIFTNEKIMNEKLDIKTHSGNVIKSILPKKNQLLNSIVFMNELIVTYPELREFLAAIIIEYLHEVENSEGIIAKLGDKTSGIFMLRWSAGNWGNFKDVNPLDLALVEEIHRVGK